MPEYLLRFNLRKEPMRQSDGKTIVSTRGIGKTIINANSEDDARLQAEQIVRDAIELRLDKLDPCKAWISIQPDLNRK